ncbi:MAG: channel protein TolC [Desulfuromonas sp.]|nr:MAG: channel protein TolC [Desulfuromonas sp.]
MQSVKTGILICLCVGLFFSHAVCAQETLQGVIKHAVSNNPKVLATWEAFNESSYEKKAVTGTTRPRLDLDARIAHEHNEYPFGDAHFQPVEATLSLRQLLFDGFFTPNEIDRLSYQKLSSYYSMLEASEEIAFETTRAYADVLKFRDLLDFANENYYEHLQIYQQVKERVDSGVGRGVDLEQASGRLSLAESNRITEANNLHDVTARYLRLVGLLPQKEMADLPELSFSEIPDDVKETLKQSFRTNPAFNAAIVNVFAAKKNRDAQKSRKLPTLEFLAYYDIGNDRESINGHSDKKVAEINLSYNIFNGNSDVATISRYSSHLNRARYLREKACHDLRQTVSISHTELQLLELQLISLQNHQEAIAKARRAYRNQFDIGQRTLLDLLDSENEFFRARRAYTIAVYDYFLANTRILSEMGLLLSSLDIRPEGLPGKKDLDFSGENFDPEKICLAEPVPEALYMWEEIQAAGPMDSDGDGVFDHLDLCPGTLPGVKVNIQGCELKFTLQIEFDSAKADIRPEYHEQITAAVTFIQQYPTAKVLIVGHTDSNGTDELNQKLSERRAETLKSYLVEYFEINEDRLITEGYGEKRPIADNTTDIGRQKNRRVEFILNPPVQENVLPQNP